MKKKIVFIGNSIVAGYPWSKGKSFPSVIRREWSHDTVGLDIVNKGVNGDTTAGILDRFEADVLNHNPDMVFIMSGTNDFIYRDADPGEAFSNLQIMAAQLDEIGAIPVYLTPVPVDAGKAECMWMAGLGVSYSAVNRDLEELTKLILESGRNFVNLNSSFREYTASFDDPDKVFLDGIHPMPDGHVFIAGEILKFLQGAVQGLMLKDIR